MKCIILFLFVSSLFGTYETKDFSHLYEMEGFDKELLHMHFTLYEGYVKNSNFLLKELSELAKEKKTKSYEYGALKRRLGWEMDGMRLHELYFTNLGGNGKLSKSSSLYKAIEANFGSFEAWKEEFIATGLIRGIGWSILYEDPESKRLFNLWINEHDVGHLAGGVPLLIMDVFEHAYITQFGLNRAKYIEVFFDHINWRAVEKRFSEQMPYRFEGSARSKQSR